MQELIERFEPLISSYARKTGWKIETEDMESLLTIKLIELTRKMPVDENESKNVSFIAQSLKNYFLDIVRKINRTDAVEMVTLDYVEEQGGLDEDVSVFIDMIKILDEKKQKIIILKFRGMYTDQEIATILHISRQAVHKHLKKAYEQLRSTT